MTPDSNSAKSFGRYNEAVEKRRMCPNCRAFIEITDRVCPYCGSQLGPRAIDMRASQLASSFLPRANLTSLIVLIINVCFYLVELIMSNRYGGVPVGELSPRAAMLLGAEIPFEVHSGQWWRLITAGFLHGGFWHIAVNSWSLFILVTEVEQFYGTSRFIVAYVVSTFTGFLFSYLFSGGWALGASAAAFGMFGIMLAMGLRHRSDPLAQAVRAHYSQWLILGLVLSFVPGISLSAHLGGLVGGFLVGIIAGLPGLPNTPREALWRVLAVVAIAITVFAFWRDYQSFHAMALMSNT
jgi:rhomboid protease GluP